MIKVSRQWGQGRETQSRACIPLPGLEAGPTHHSEPQSILGYSSEQDILVGRDGLQQRDKSTVSGTR